MLKREDILKATPAPNKPEPVFTEQLWEGYIKRMTALEALSWQEYTDSQRGPDGKIAHPDIWRAKLVQLSYCDADGVLVFVPTDVTAMSQQLTFATIAMLFTESLRVNCLTDYYAELEAKRLRDFFASTQKNDSGQDSASSSTSQTRTS